MRLERISGSDSAHHPHNYMPRSEHVRLLEARLSTQAAESEAEMHRKLNETRKEVQFRVRHDSMRLPVYDSKDTRVYI